MSKGQWGRIIAGVAAIVVIVLVVLHLYSMNAKPTATTSEIAVPHAASQDQAAASGVESTAPNTGETSSAAGTDTSTSGGVSSAGGNAAGQGAGASPVGESKAALQKEAESYVKQLTQSSNEPLQVGNAEGFVKGNRPLELNQAGAGTRAEAGETPAAAREPEEAKASEAPGTAQSGQAASLEATGATESRGEEAPGITTGAQPQQASSPAAAMAGSSAAGESSEVESEQGASAGGAPGSASAETGVKSARQVSVDLPVNEQAPVTIADIIGAGAEVPPDAVYYVHTVQSNDDQGIWGIVQSGVVENFAEGVAVRHGDHSSTYRVDIPHDADELRADHSSSFLGELIYEKSKESYVYNFKTGRIGKNPNLIKPGQEIVIVSFTPEELIDIYKHFVYQQGMRRDAKHS